MHEDLSPSLIIKLVHTSCISTSIGNGTTFCGNEIPPPHFVNDTDASLTFVTDGDLDYPGFVVEVEFIRTQKVYKTVNSSPALIREMTSASFESKSYVFLLICTSIVLYLSLLIL